MNKRGEPLPNVAREQLNIGDNEYMILTQLAEDDSVNQRQLSKKLGVSLGTVNALLTKMAREGKIKVEQVSGRQVAYMLTPNGMLEKAKKTVSYLKGHYRAIYESKEKIKRLIDQLAKRYDYIVVLKNKDEFGAIVDIALSEYNATLAAIELDVIYTLDQLKPLQPASKSALFNATAKPLKSDQLPSGYALVNALEKL